MNRSSTSKEEIMKQARMILQRGDDLNVRTLANACNVSVGCIYNYFPSKVELVLATTESVWEEILGPGGAKIRTAGLEAVIEDLVGCFHFARNTYPGFFERHALRFEGNSDTAQAHMQRTLQIIRDRIVAAAMNDADINSMLFDAELTAEAFGEQILGQLIGLAIMHRLDKQTVLEYARRFILEKEI